jgi:hypothetical protein
VTFNITTAKSSPGTHHSRAFDAAGKASTLPMANRTHSRPLFSDTHVKASLNRVHFNFIMSEETEGRVIDESGDVELLVGPRKCRIRVSSKVLSLSSKVFSIMSSDEFKEGNDLRTK